MTLPPRLKKIVEFADKCGVVADIGTDHALVPVYLIENRFYNKAYACDIRPLPLKRADEKNR
ncbi:MAG: tRNA (adenine(22)-N(1))-methyltransferase TrmK [Clostridia bacterium]|nr:tRNA (adenine(22)-N(1))-methyltransferase TrmK [Clostridia bacterium]